MRAVIPRALHLLTRSTGGGTEVNVHRLCEAVPEFHVRSLEQSLGWPLRWHRLPRLVRDLRAVGPQVVFCYGVTAHLAAMLAFPFATPLIGSIRCESDFAGRKGLIRSIIRARFSAWVSNSRMALRGECGIVIYNGIPEPPPDEKPMLTGLRSPVFGILARGHAKKGHGFAIRLWHDLGKPGSLVFAGDLGSEIKRAAEQEGVICPGFVEPGPLLRSLDLLLIPSEAEGIPTVLLEAMIRGIPCLAAPVGGIPEVMRHGQNGYLLPREEWMDFLRSFDEGDAERVGAAGRAFAGERLGFERMKERFIAVARHCARG